MSPPDPWKWKWSNGIGKSEMIIIWCISIINNVKSNKKFNETAQTANFTDFPLILCGNGPKGTKTMQMQTLFSLLQKIWKLASCSFWKCGVFLWYNFFNRSYCCSKLGQISRIFFAKLRRHKKYMWLQYYVSGQIVESAWSHTYWLHAEFNDLTWIAIL